jgi:hypothetical protein
VLVKWPRPPDDALWSLTEAIAGEDGRFQIADLAPGQYRGLALTAADRAGLDEPGVLERLLSSAPNVTLAAGLQAINLNLTQVR